MTENEILSRVADLTIGRKLYDMVVPIRLVWWQRAFNRFLPARWGYKPYRVFELYPSVSGNMIRIADRAMSLPAELIGNGLSEIALPLISKHGNDVIYIVAAGIQNNKHEPKKGLIDFLLDNAIGEVLYDALNAILDEATMQAFINSTILIKGTDSILKPRVDPIDGSE